MAEGRGGVVKKFLDHTTPSARTNEASRLFLIVQPPLLLLVWTGDMGNACPRTWVTPQIRSIDVGGNVEWPGAR